MNAKPSPLSLALRDMADVTRLATDWKARAIAAEAECERLRAIVNADVSLAGLDAAGRGYARAARDAAEARRSRDRTISAANAFARAARKHFDDSTEAGRLALELRNVRVLHARYRSLVRARYTQLCAEVATLATIVRAFIAAGPCPEKFVDATDPCAYCGAPTGEWFTSLRAKKVDGVIVAAHAGDPRFDELGKIEGGITGHAVRALDPVLHTATCALGRAEAWAAEHPVTP